MLLVAITRLVD